MRGLYKFVLMCLVGAFFETVLCSHDVHRIVLKTHYRKHRERDHHKYYPDHRPIRKPTVYDESNEDDWPIITTQRPHHHYNNYRSNYKNESSNGYRRGKPRNYTTVQSQPPLNIADVIELTTSYPEKLALPILESTFHQYYFLPSNNSLDSYSSSESKQSQDDNLIGKVRQLREKEIGSPKNVSKGYEVYEEIIGDLSPPPPPNLLLNNIQNWTPVNTTPFPVVTVEATNETETETEKHEENHIKENVTEASATSVKTYGKRIKSRRNRGYTQFH